MKTKLALVFMIVAAMFIPQSLVFGQRGGFGGWGGMFGGPMQAAYLGLTQDQMSQIKTMQHTEWSALKSQMQQLGTYQQQLRAMTQSTTALNPTALSALVGQITAIQAQLTVARTQMQWQIYNNVLTATQQAQLSQLQQNMQQMRQNRHNAHSSSSSSNQ